MTLGSTAALGAQRAALAVPIVVSQVPITNQRPPKDWSAHGLVRADRFHGARLTVLTPEGKTKVLSADFHSACDPDVSYDAKRIVFAAKKEASSPWAIWEVGVDGLALRQVTREERDCRSPMYLGSLFTLDSPEPWYTLAFVGTESTANELGTGSATSLYSIKLDGTERRRLTFNPSASFDPVPMWDGKLLYAAWQFPIARLGDPGRVALFSVHIDGMEPELFASGGQRIQHMPCPTEGGRVVCVESDSMAWDGAGQLAAVNEQRPHYSHQALTSDPRYAWLYPTPMGTNEILVSRRSAKGRHDCGLFLFNLESRKVTTVFDTPKFHELQAKAIRPRRVPDGRSTVVETKYATGRLFGLNCYLADARMQPHLAPGGIRRLRVIEGVPAALPAAASSRTSTVSPLGRRLLGEAPVERDGSFHLEIPADLPVQLQALDSNGVALATCSWVWVKQRENRGCIGCHEDPELMPQNAFALALGRKGNSLTLPPDKRRGVGFREHVAPVLRDKCATADCHGDADSPLRMILPAKAGNETELRRVYAALLGDQKEGSKRYVVAGRARTSFLIWQILGRDVSRPWDHDAVARPPANDIKPMPPPNARPLTAEERQLLIEWVDLGAPWAAPESASPAVSRSN